MLQGLIFFATILFASPAWATSYYVAATGGDNSRSCVTAQNVNTPKLTITSGVGCLTAAGDTLYVRTGNYDESVIYTSFPASGTSGSRITVTNYNGEVVTIKPTGTKCRGLLVGPGKNWITFDGINFDGVLMSGCTALNPQVGTLIAADKPGPTGLTIRNADIANGPISNILDGDQVVLEYLTVHGTGWRAQQIGYANGSNGLYLEGISNSIVRRVVAYDNHCSGIRVYNSAASPAANNNILEYNILYSNGKNTGLSGTSDCQSNGGGFVIGDDNNIVRYNLIYNNSATGRGIWVYQSFNATSGNKFYHNTIYNSGNGIVTDASTTTSTFTNNISVGNGQSNYSNAGTNTTLVTNKTTGSITDCTVSTSDFTHKAASSCIDAGTVITGYQYNGTAPDQGAFEVPKFSSCTVEDGDASTVRVTFTNNLNPPLLPSSSPGTFTVRKATVADTVTASTVTGTNRVDLTVQNAFASGNAADISWASGNLTDSALIGNSLNQPYVTVLTNQSCTNNVSAAPTHVFTQAAFEFHSLRGTEAAPVGLPYAAAPENVNIYSIPGGQFRVRVSITCTSADCPSKGFIPYYKLNSGSYTVLPSTFGSDNVAFCGTNPDTDIPTDGTVTTDQLSTSGTFVAGALLRTSNAIPTVDLAQNGKTEIEICVALDTDVTAADVYSFRFYEQDGTAFGAYTVTPTATVMAARGAFGF